MGFMRRKSVAASEAEEVRPRNRLTKPMTAKSPTTQRVPAEKQSPQTVSSPQALPGPSANGNANIEQGALRRDNSFNIGEEAKTTRPGLKKPGVASLVKQFEDAASSSRLSSVSSISKKPVPATYFANRLGATQSSQSFGSNGILEQTRSIQNSSSTLPSASASLERLIDPFAIPRQRESNYRPGEATRKHSVSTESTEQTPERPKPDTNKPLPPVSPPNNTQDNQGRDLRPSLNRTQTPGDVDFGSIGRTGLGSLQVVNGRSSPVLSELSRHLISKQLRDVSSEYADSTYSNGEDWEDDAVVEDADDTEVDEPQTPTRTTPEPRPRSPFTPVNQATKQDLTPNNGFETPVQSPDKTSIMAEAYMAEIKGSPFSYGSVSPPSARNESDSSQSVSPLSTGSVIHHELEEEDDEGLEEVEERRAEQRKASLESNQMSIGSKPSGVGTVDTRDQVFSSALEYQTPTFQPPPSPERGLSPDSSELEAFGRPYEKIDSGYNSGTSMLSFHHNDPKAGKKYAAPQSLVTQTKEESISKVDSAKCASPKTESSPRKLGRFFPIRPGLRKSPATAPVVPTLENLKPASTVMPKSTSTTNVHKETPTKMKKPDNETKSPKKLTKLRPHSRVRESKEIIVQRLPSCESTLDLPAVSPVVAANLQRRSQQVPELEKTYTSQNHIKNQPSVSNLALPMTDIRFPSPIPELDDDERPAGGRKKDRDRSKARPRSKSRRRSFLDMFKSDKEIAKREASTYGDEPKMQIADFGDVVASLGANPYDVAHAPPRQTSSSPRKPSNHNTNPHDISVNRQRKRLSMTDEEASEYARARSYSGNGHGDRDDRRPNILERTGLPGRYLRASMTEVEVPPMPPLPDEEELRRISVRQSLQFPYLISTPTSEQRFFEGTPTSDRYPESSPAPLPPAHSPRPSFVDHDYENEYEVDDLELAPPPPPSHSPAPVDVLAPPPPSHSPRPRELEEPDSPWNAQARAWRSRRLSASEALKTHRQSLELRGGEYDHEEPVHGGDELSYPVIPPRHPGRDSNSQQSLDRHSQSNHGRQLPYPAMQRSNTWDDSGHNQYDYQQEYAVSRSSFQSRQKRHNTWDDGHIYPPSSASSRFQHNDVYGGRQSQQRSRTSLDSRNSFYSHQNGPIDRPFDRQPHLAEDSDDEYGYHGQQHSAHSSPVRGRQRQRHEYDYSGYNGYEGNYDPQPYSNRQSPNQPRGAYNNDYGHPNHHRRQPQRPESYRRFPSHSPNPPRNRSRNNSLIPPSPAASRPSSRQSHTSFRSNGSAVSLAEELHPEISKRPSPAPDFGRYSGGMNFGYEGRGTGFGGSAGTRSVSGKADGMFKGMEVRENFGVDLGDVPVIGVLKKVK